MAKAKSDSLNGLEDDPEPMTDSLKRAVYEMIDRHFPHIEVENGVEAHQPFRDFALELAGLLLG